MEISRYFRLSNLSLPAKSICKLLQGQGFGFSKLPFFDFAFKLEQEPFPLGSSLAAKFGLIYIQDASSMLPALALHKIITADLKVQPRAKKTLAVLDCCSSPGGKSSLIAALLGNNAFVLANEPTQKRHNTLRHNLEQMNLFNTASSAYSGDNLPLPTAWQADPTKNGFEGFDYILLDPPCSGWGTADKNPKVLELWQGDKIKPLITLQKQLLKEALRLLKPNGALVYSTCTLNVEENEEQINWALERLSLEEPFSKKLKLNELSIEELNEKPNGGKQYKFVKIPIAPFEGFEFDEPHNCAQTLRVSKDSPLGQGFYIAALRKIALNTELNPKDKDFKKEILKSSELSWPSWYDSLYAEVQSPSKTTAKNKTNPERNFSAEYSLVDKSALDSALLDKALLPDGELLFKNGKLSFFPLLGLKLLPANFNWCGLQLGSQSNPQSSAKLKQYLPALMPSAETIKASGAEVLQLEIEEIQALLTGQSLNVASQAKELALFYKDLPLCRLKIKNGRVLI